MSPVAARGLTSYVVETGSDETVPGHQAMVDVFGGRVVRELSGAEADEPALLRAAYNLRHDSVLPEAVAAEAVAAEESAPTEGSLAVEESAPTEESVATEQNVPTDASPVSTAEPTEGSTNTSEEDA